VILIVYATTANHMCEMKDEHLLDSVLTHNPLPHNAAVFQLK
jgi:hypothetical protein